jgi:hypothetical protein
MLHTLQSMNTLVRYCSITKPQGLATTYQYASTPRLHYLGDRSMYGPFMPCSCHMTAMHVLAEYNKNSFHQGALRYVHVETTVQC